jgi:hypothetical protein
MPASGRWRELSAPALDRGRRVVLLPVAAPPRLPDGNFMSVGTTVAPCLLRPR